MTKASRHSDAERDYPYLRGQCDVISSDEPWIAFKMDDEGERLIRAGGWCET
jgi:hypothetical protein